MSTAITMYIAVMFLMTWIPAKWKRRVVGYGLIADLTVHIVLQTMFGGDANGRAGLLLAGVLINGTMHLYRKLYGYEKLTTAGWERFAGVMTKPEPKAPPTKPKARPANPRGAAARARKRR